MWLQENFYLPLKMRQVRDFSFIFTCDTKQNDNDPNLKVHGTTVQDAPYWILDTDYENYAVVWSCSENAGMKAGKCKKKKS